MISFITVRGPRSKGNERGHKDSLDILNYMVRAHAASDLIFCPSSESSDFPRITSLRPMLWSFRPGMQKLAVRLLDARIKI
jgi:hypothetical protein